MPPKQITPEVIANSFKVNVASLITYFADAFSCETTRSQLKLLQTIVFPSQSFTHQMIMQWHVSMRPFYEEIERNSIDSMIASKSIWFVERIQLASKYARLDGAAKNQVIEYFKGLNKLSRNFAAMQESELARFLAATAAAKAAELPELAEDQRVPAQWVVQLTQNVLGALSSEQVAQVVGALPDFVAAMGGADKVLEQARELSLVSAEPDKGESPLDAISKLLNPDVIRSLVAGLQENTKDVSVPSKSGEAVALSDIVGDTTKVLTDIVEGKADASEVAGLGQRLTETVDWDSIMSMLPPEISTVGRSLVGQLSAQTGAASGAGEEAPDMSKVLETVSSLASSFMTPDSPFASILSGLVSSAGGESPLAALLTPKKE